MKPLAPMPAALAVLISVAAPPAFAQAHDHHRHASPPPERVDHSQMDHSRMDHSKMDHAQMDHSTMDHGHAGHGHGAPAADAAVPREPIPALTDADRAAAFPAIDHGAMIHASPVNSLLLLERLEHWDGRHGNGQSWEVTGWLGTDLDRLWLRSEGERSGGRTEAARIELMYGRSISPWWDVLAGVRQDVLPGDDRSWAAFGLQGLAPYKFETSATVHVGSGGQVMAEAEIEYEVLLSNRLILQPLLEVSAAARSEPRWGIGSGVNKLETGLRLRYEFSRRFAPYIGIGHERRYGDAADFADHRRDTRWVAGVRMWF